MLRWQYGFLVMPMVDLDEGTYNETEVTYLSVKYEKEVRLCLGCAITEDINGKDQGLTAVPFDYSGNIILSIPDYEKQKRTEIEQVRTGLKDGGAWVVHASVQGSIYSVDPISALDHIGGVTVTNLKEGFSIETVGHLKACLRDIQNCCCYQGPFDQEIGSGP
jgi:hypothetical protein